jgi:hypothetical protein
MKGIVMSKDASITETDVEHVKRDIQTRVWHAEVIGLMEREPQLMQVVVLQEERIRRMLARSVPFSQDRERLHREMQLLVWSALILLDRSHRRLWTDFLPADPSQPAQGDSK